MARTQALENEFRTYSGAGAEVLLDLLNLLNSVMGAPREMGHRERWDTKCTDPPTTSGVFGY